MKRRVFLASLLAMAAVPRSVAAQGAAKVVRIGWLTAQQAPSLAPYVDAMRTALADLGYVEGRNLVIEFRYGDDVIERVPELAAELVRSPIDLIVAQGAAAFEIRGLGLGPGWGGRDTLVSIEGANGSQFDDTMIGQPVPNQFRGRGGNDHFYQIQ
jgi:hypothetical protein